MEDIIVPSTDRLHTAGLKYMPGNFEKEKLIYTKEYRGQGISQEFEIEFVLLDRWDNLN
jgi:hypothetical protein